MCLYAYHNLGLPVRGNPPDDLLAFEEDNRQDMIFVLIRGESVCNFEHTLDTYEAQLAEAEIDIPKNEQKKRLKFLEERYEAACDDDE